MKNRLGFVSNSSSASFIIARKDITDKQFQQILNYEEEAELLNMENIDNFWEITYTDQSINGLCIMDNFEFDTFLSLIGVDMTKVIFEGENYDIDYFDLFEK